VFSSILQLAGRIHLLGLAARPMQACRQLPAGSSLCFQSRAMEPCRSRTQQLDRFALSSAPLSCASARRGRAVTP